MQIKEIMKKATAISPSITVKEAAKAMAVKGIGSLIIIDKNKIVGIITERDILKSFAGSGKPTTSINKIMSKNVKTIKAGADIMDAATIMTQNKIKRLPVIEKDKLIGIVTATDLVAHSEDFDEPFFFSSFLGERRLQM